jgi:hypothetical protein
MSAVDNIASVYDEQTGLYNYYRTPAGERLGRPWTMLGNPVGTPVQDALPKLPTGSRYIGRGERALGTIAQGATDWKERALRYGAIGLGVYIVGRIAGIFPPIGRHHG